MDPVQIELNNLAIGYKSGKTDKVVAHRLNATLKSGTLTCLLGPNGAGKSTLLRTLCNFQPTLQGSITINGRNLNTYSIAEMARLVSVVLTHNEQNFELTAYEVIAMGRTPYTGLLGILNEEDRRIIDECVTLTGVKNLLNRKTNTLSDGERQKVMVTKALAQQTPILYLDEPTAFLDYPTKVQLIRMLKQLARKLNKVIFLSTHDIDQALQVADQIWLLDQEKGLTTGTTDELCRNNSIGCYFNRDGLKFDNERRTFHIE